MQLSRWESGRQQAMKVYQYNGQLGTLYIHEVHCDLLNYRY